MLIDTEELAARELAKEAKSKKRRDARVEKREATWRKAVAQMRMKTAMAKKAAAERMLAKLRVAGLPPLFDEAGLKDGDDDADDGGDE